MRLPFLGRMQATKVKKSPANPEISAQMISVRKPQPTNKPTNHKKPTTTQKPPNK